MAVYVSFLLVLLVDVHAAVGVGFAPAAACRAKWKRRSIGVKAEARFLAF